MPGTAHGFTNHQTVGEWTLVVSTGSTHGEEFIAAAHQEYVLAISLPKIIPPSARLATGTPVFKSGFAEFSIDSQGSISPLLIVPARSTYP